MAKTLFDKVWDKHVIAGKEGDPQLLYVDLHLIHEVTSPQPFDGLRQGAGSSGGRIRPLPPSTTTSQPRRPQLLRLNR